MGRSSWPLSTGFEGYPAHISEEPYRASRTGPPSTRRRLCDRERPQARCGFRGARAARRDQGDAATECDGRVWVARKLEFSGSRGFGIAIRGTDHDENQLARGDRLPVHFHVARGDAQHPLQRRAVAQHLFNCDVGRLGVARDGQIGLVPRSVRIALPISGCAMRAAPRRVAEDLPNRGQRGSP